MELTATLVPFSDIEVAQAGLIARSGQPWLSLQFDKGAPRGRWIRISYRASYLDHLVRPLIRFDCDEGVEWDVMSAPLFGRTSWIGRVPDRCARVLVSPVDRPGPFGFELDGVETVSRFSLLPRAFRHDRKTAAMAIGARLINARQETRQALRFARGGVDMQDYEQWREERFRPFDAAGFDAPRARGLAPHIRFILGPQKAPVTPATPLLASLFASRGGDWSIVVARVEDVDQAACSMLGSRLIVSSAEDSLVDGLAENDLVARVDPCICLMDCALPIVIEAAARDAGAVCFYVDEEWRDPDGVARPALKPDWSPDFQAALNYLGEPVFWRVGKVRRMGTSAADFETGPWRRHALQDAAPAAVQHIRRIIASRPAPPSAMAKTKAPSGEAMTLVSVIIPTKNQLPLLRECLRGLRLEASGRIAEILIVDNGSDAPVQDFYETLEGDARIKVMRMPGRFNFSAMCNAAAAAATGDCLVFLNNDISVLEPDWLRPLVALAMRPDVGAVGARLLFPDGSIQHSGVAVGMGGYADHVSHGAPGDHAGYLGRLGAVHEAGAVTGACIAVEARKFHAVEGFDAERFPVELNDIDLCLRLARAGWRTLMSPRSVLIHHQSATRGFSFRPFERYGLERGHFRDMWRDAIRDDPYFHPALSLFSPEPALDG